MDIINKFLSLFYKKKERRGLNLQNENFNDDKIVQIICRFSDERCSICHQEIEKNEKMIVDRGYKFHEDCLEEYNRMNCRCCSDCSNEIEI